MEIAIRKMIGNRNGVVKVYEKMEQILQKGFQGNTSVVVPYCSCCLCLYFGSSIMLVTYFVNIR